MHTNIIIIGMAAAGKSTIGRHLAHHLDWAFVDTDLLIEAWWGAPLQHIASALGREDFLRTEEAQILSLSLKRCVIATGGSVVYSTAAMEHLTTLGHLIYLRSSYATIEQRLNNPNTRGLAIAPGQSIRDLYEERAPLYARYATHTIQTDGQTPQEICAQIYARLPIPQDLS